MNTTRVFLAVALGALGLPGGVPPPQQSSAPGGARPPPPVTVSTRWNGGPETREEDRRFHVNGRFQYDVASTDADCAHNTCTGVNESGIRSYARRAFLGVDGRLTDNWRYNVKFDFNLANNGG